MELNGDCRQSFDITDRTPPSPAPTYSSRFHAEKDYITPHHASNSSAHNPNFVWEDEKPFRPNIDAKPAHKDKETSDSTKAGHEDFQPLEEPHDPNHPHYTPLPRLPQRSLPPHPPPTKRRRFPLKVLIPWTLALIFFLTTLWYTSIALGVRFFNILSPPVSTTQQPPEINIQINGQDLLGAAASPGFRLDTAAIITPTPGLISTKRNGNHGNEFDTDEGTNTVTGPAAEGSVTVTETPKSTLVTITRKAVVND